MMKVKVEVCKHDEEECECELLDTSLSGVSEQDCSCSDCLEANLEAYNEFEIDFIPTNKPLTNLKARSQTSDAYRKTARTQPKISTSKCVGIKKESLQPFKKSFNHSKIPQPFEKQQPHQEAVQEDYKGIEDFVRLTQFRTKLYLKQRKLLLNSQIEKKKLLKLKIMENLQKLKYSTRYLQRNSPLQHPHKWGHNTFVKCGRKQEVKSEIQSDPHCKDPKFNEQKKSALDTNLREKVQNFEAKRDEILEQRKQERLRKLEQINNKKCLDDCQHHPCKANPERMKKIDKFISDNAEKLKKKMIKRKLKKAQKEKVKQAKLRAIDLKCKEILAKTKKYQPIEEKSNFHQSIDHYSTFSDLKLANQIRKQQKIKRKEAEEDIKKNPQIYEKAVFQNIDQFQPLQKPNSKKKEFEQQKQQQLKSKKQQIKEKKEPPKCQDIKQKKQFNKKEKNLTEKQIQQKILLQAQLDSPSKNKQKIKKQKIRVHLSSHPQEEFDLKKEIQKKKREIQEQYEKQNAIIKGHKVKNKKLREDYEASLQTKKQKKQLHDIQQDAIDPYRSNYKVNANKDALRMKIQGDPLLHENRRDANIKKASMPTEQIFTADLNTLIKKEFL